MTIENQLSVIILHGGLTLLMMHNLCNVIFIVYNKLGTPNVQIIVFAHQFYN